MIASPSRRIRLECSISLNGTSDGTIRPVAF
jgi:hypothetical protein